MTEVERSFLVSSPPGPVGDGSLIRQAYVAIDGQVEVRVRERDGRYRLTVKTGSGMERGEIEVAIERTEFDHLWDSSDGRTITKTRYELPVAGFTAELDVFAGALEGLMLVEVEFADVEIARHFAPPGWFGREVTDELGWSNQSLAVHGRPDS